MYDILLSLCANTEQWQKFRAGKSGRTGLSASGIWNSHKTPFGPAACQCSASEGQIKA